MASRAQIEINYRQAIRQAERLEELSQNMRRSGDSVEKTMHELSSGWQGDAANSYRIKGQKMAEKIVREAKQLKRAAETLRSIAERVRQAELESIRITEVRKYE